MTDKRPRSPLGMYSLPISPIFGYGRTPRGSGIHDAGYLAQGNINPKTRPVTLNMNEGGYSTVDSGSYENNAGQEVLIPTVSDQGDIMTMPEAMAYWGKKGKHLGKFASPSQADAYAMWLHLQQAQQYANWGLLPPMPTKGAR